MKKILVIGSINIDLVTRVQKTPNIGETVLGEHFFEFPGGKGANQAVAISRLGGDVTMLGRVGIDAHGKSMKTTLKNNGVDTKYVEISKTSHTGIALIMVNANGDNSIVVIPGANFDILPDDITEELIREFDIIVGQLEVPMNTLERAFRIAKSFNKMTILNPAPAQNLSSTFMSTISLLIPNKSELEFMTNIPITDNESICRSYEKLKEAGIQKLLLTLGSVGSAYIDSQGLKRYPARKIKAVDTTAAGDSFIGGLVTRLAIGESMERAILYATKAASISVSKMGAQPSLPYEKDVI
ncbi:MAG: ribokinase [Clostridiales bacterium]|nr:ribokinase [Clostridiales bacterium]